MKHLPLLFLLSASLGFAEEATLPKSAVMQVDRSLVTLKAGTVVEIVSRDAKRITIKVDGKTGTIPLNSLPAADAAKPGPAVAATPPAPPPAPASAATATAPRANPVLPPAPAQGAVTNYGKMVEKARANEKKHEKALVDPTNEIMDGK